MTDMKVGIDVRMQGNLARQARKNTAALARMARDGKAAMKGLGKSVGAVTTRLRRLGNRYTAFFGAAAIGLAGKKIIDFDAALASVGGRSGKTGKDLDTFTEKTKKLLFEIAQRPQFKIDPRELLEGMDAIITKTGDLDLALSSLPSLALMIRGGESQGADAGALVADLNQKLKITRKEMSGALGDITAGGDKGSFEIKDFAPLSERILAAFGKSGRTGPSAVREVGAFLQMFKRTMGSPEMAVTAFERFMDTITVEKAKLLRDVGIQIWEPDQLKKGLNVLRSPIEILKEIIIKADAIASKRKIGIGEVLGQIFDIRAGRGVESFTKEFQNAKAADKPEEAFKFVDSLLKVKGGEDLLRRRSIDFAKRAKATVQELGTKIDEAADKVLGPMIKTGARVTSDVIEGKGPDAALDEFRDTKVGQALKRTLERGTDFIRDPLGLTEAPEKEQLDRYAQEILRRFPEAKVTVKFENLPAGARVKGESKDLDLHLDTGRSMVAP